MNWGAFVWPAAGLIVVLALAARLYNVGWDDNTHLHPDERHLTIVANDVELPGGLGEYFDSAESPLNPYNRPGGVSFVYGTLPLFLTKGTAVVLGQDDYDHIVLVGRYWSALFSGATVLLVFLAGRRLYGAVAGLFGAALLATAPLAIQQAHFFVVDPFATFFITAVLYFSIRIGQEGRRGDYLLAGLALGLGVACKVTALLAAPVIVLAAGQEVWPVVRQAVRVRLDVDWLEPLQRPLLWLTLAAALALVTFRIAQPYAFDAPALGNLGFGLSDRWLDDQRQQSELLSGRAAFPPSVQWIDRTSYLFPLEEMIGWGMGPAFGVAGWAALLYAAYRLVKRREGRHLLPVLFVLLYFAFMGRQFSLYLRYFLPLYPALALLAGYGLVELAAAGRPLAQRLRLPLVESAVFGGIGGVLLLAVLAGVAYVSIYTQPVTRVEAAAWLRANIPVGKTIGIEHWDDGLPVRDAAGRYSFVELAMYEPDSPEKVSGLIEDLAAADYVVLSSNRLVNSIPRNTVNYPISARYYDLLLSEQLGFRLLREFTSYPRILGVEFADHGAEESWSSYDHPRVLIFEKTPAFSARRLELLLGQGPFADATLTPAQADNRGLLLSAEDLKTQRKGGTWTDVFSDSGIVASNPTLAWLLALEAAALAAMPLALVLFRRLPDRGYLLSKPLGLLLLAYPVWLLVSLKLVQFTQSTVLATLVVLLAVATVVTYRWRGELWTFLKSHWRLVLFCEALLLLSFFFFRELRMLNPDLWHPFRGGEKPMDLAYLTAVARSTTLPPYDPWFAGGYINYYYLGQFFTATLIKLTTIPPEVAYNLAVPTFFALTVAATFSVAYNLAAAARGLIRRSPGFRPIPAWSPYAAGLLGVFLVAFAGNLDGVGQMVERLSVVSAWHSNTNLPLVDSVVNSVGGAWQVLAHGANLPEFDYWRSSRMMPPSISITEFPYFSFLFADLHAHMMAIAFQILAIGIGLSLVLGLRGERGSWREWVILALLGLVVGSLRWINSWDYPPFLLLALAALVISERSLEGGYLPTIGRLAFKAALVVAVSFLAYQPFLSNYQSPVSGVIEAPETTPMHQYLAHFGVFAALIGAWLLFHLVRDVRATPAWHNLRSSAGQRQDLAWLLLAGSVLFFVAALAFFLIDRGNSSVAMLLPVLALVIYLAVREALQQRPDVGIRLFVLALIGLGLGLSMGVDLVTLKGDITRMNTVFKFYLHTWVVFALATSFVTWHLAFVVWRPSLSALGRPLPKLVASGGVACLTLLLLGAMIYPIFATPVRLNDRFEGTAATLDGIAYMQVATYDDQHGLIDLSQEYEGIQWLRHNVEGTPVIVEGRAELYRWGGRFSIYTGLPAVLGWDWHQVQQRGDYGYMVGQRAVEVDAFYAEPDVFGAQSFLRRYQVSYVILGRVERLYYPASGLRKFQTGLGGVLEVAFQNEDLTIYRVKPEALSPGLAALP